MTIDDGLMYRALYQLSRNLHQDSYTVPEVIQRTLNQVDAIAGVAQGCALMFSQAGSIQHLYLSDRTTPDTAPLWRTLAERGLAGFVYYAQRTVVVRNIETDPRWIDTPDDLCSGSAIGLPLIRGRSVYGVLLFTHPRVDYFQQSVIEVLEEVTDLLAATINQILDRQGVLVSKDRYHIAFGDAVVPVLLTDLNGRILGVNRRASELLGYERQALVDHPITEIHHLDPQTLGDRGLQGLSIGEEITWRTWAVNATGHEIPVIVRVRRLLVDYHDVVEWVEQDITQQIEHERLRDDLSAMVYHDLRGPLHTIRGSVQKLAELLANHDDATVARLLQVGVRSTRQLTRMVESLLDLQRLEEGKSILKRQLMPLPSILADASQLAQPLAIEARQHLVFDMPDNLPDVVMDGDMIVRVVVNLLENAVKYTPDGGTIRLAATADSDCVYISVSDSGPGIPAEQQSTIFDKFNRVKYDNAPNGVGLGLAFCRLAVHAHGGDIWVESEPGQGATFTFALPLHTETDQQRINQLVSTA